LQSPHEAFGASTLSIHFLQHSMPVPEQAHTHIYRFPLPSDNSQTLVVFLISVHIQGCLFLV
jgi:hypothetical protein